MFAWDETLSIGILRFDREHQALFAQLSKLHDAITQGCSLHVQERILRELVRHAVQHFRNEEHFMRSAQYPGYEAHAIEHRNLEHKILDLELRMQRNAGSIESETLAFLRNWVVQHIQECDSKLATCVPTPTSHCSSAPASAGPSTS
ncbi:MAG: hemerythrin family protein [Phycisphaerales bacterium]|nr:hemerythrin family protein [Phycisphaerales bacterium]